MKNFFIKKKYILFLMLIFDVTLSIAQEHKAPAPMYRDPITDGAADPVMIYNRQNKCWTMFYTQRRANSNGADVAFCFGTSIGVAESYDHGKSWIYRGKLNLDFEHGQNTFWAPDIVYQNGTYYMFVSYIKGVHNHFGTPANIISYTSKDLWNWTYKGATKLSSNQVIDPTLYKNSDGKWLMWYKDEKAGSHTMVSESKNLKDWTVKSMAIDGTAHEGPKVFRFGNYYWMLTDEWQGIRVHRSIDLIHWDKQNLILNQPGNRPEDTPNGAHGDVVVFGDKAYVIYFTHPGRKDHIETQYDADGNIPYHLRRSSIQVAKLEIEDGVLTCNRDKDFDFYLPNLSE